MRAGSALSVHILLLLGLCAVLYFPYLGNTPFFDKGEPREALAVQDIVQRGEWLFPLKRATAVPSKPPLFHWSAALISEMTGHLNEITIRFPSALYATLGVLLIFLLGRKLYGPAVALLAGAVLATTMVYSDQALSARVDMTLCFFLTLSLILFYSLYRGFLIHPLWYFTFYFVVGIGTLAKGPLGILLPGLVIAGFLVLRRRWDLVIKFAFHPGVVLTLLLAAGWYGLAISRAGEGFVDRQLLQENLKRFFGGSGHSHPIYYYFPYLFSLGLPWSLFLPFLLWDLFTKSSYGSDDRLFQNLVFDHVRFLFSIGREATGLPRAALSTAVAPARRLDLSATSVNRLAIGLVSDSRRGRSSERRYPADHQYRGYLESPSRMVFPTHCELSQAEGSRQSYGSSRCSGQVRRCLYVCNAYHGNFLVCSRPRFLARPGSPCRAITTRVQYAIWFHQSGDRYPCNRRGQELSGICCRYGSPCRTCCGDLSLWRVQQ